MSGQLCKYFLNDACRYGDNCRFVHDYDQYHYYHMSRNRSVYTPNKPRRQPPPQPKKQDNTMAEKTTSLAQEMSLIEKGKMWPFTAFGVQSHANMPGWIDYSPEELRLAYLTAVSNGTVQKYKQEYQSLLIKAAKNRNSIRSPNKQTFDTIKSIYDGKVPYVSQTSVFGSVLNNDPAPGLFRSVVKKNSASFLGQNSGFGNSGQQTPIVTNSEEFQEMEDAFGTLPVTPMTSTPLKPSQQQNKIYSKMEDLTEMEIQEFNAPTFTFLNVPFNPPPKELCHT